MTTAERAVNDGSAVVGVLWFDVFIGIHAM